MATGGMGFVTTALESKPVGVAVLAGAGAMALMSADIGEAISFGAVTALGAALGDMVLNAMDQATYLDSLYADSAYVDPSDFVAAGAMTALLEYTIAGQALGPEFAKVVLVAAVAGGVGPKLGGMISAKIKTQPQTAAQVTQ